MGLTYSHIQTQLPIFFIHSPTHPPTHPYRTLSPTCLKGIEQAASSFTHPPTYPLLQDTATHMLEAMGGDLEQAVSFFLDSGGAIGGGKSSTHPPTHPPAQSLTRYIYVLTQQEEEDEVEWEEEEEEEGGGGGGFEDEDGEVRAPMPTMRDTLMGRSPTHPPTHPPTDTTRTSSRAKEREKRQSSNQPTHPPTHPPTHLPTFKTGPAPGAVHMGPRRAASLNTGK